MPGRNSLFTEVLRTELLRPGQSLIELADRVKLMVRAIAQDFSPQQEPEIAENYARTYDVMLIGSIGASASGSSQDKCAANSPTGTRSRPEEARALRASPPPLRWLPTAERRGARSRSSRWLGRSARAPRSDGPAVSECDQLRGVRDSTARPPEVPGLLFDKMDADGGDRRVRARRSTDNPRMTRYLFNLGRAYHKRGLEPDLDPAAGTRALRSAFLAYEDATRARLCQRAEYLAVMYEIGDGVERDESAVAIDLLKRGAEQGHPLAMYNLGIRYRYGIGVRRDWGQASSCSRSRPETGFVSAMVELGDALARGRGVINPRRGVEWLAACGGRGLRAREYPARRHLLLGPLRQARTTSARRTQASRCSGFGRMAETRSNEAQAACHADAERHRRCQSPAAGDRGTLLAACRLWRRCLCAGRLRGPAAARVRAGEAGVRFA